MFELRKILLTAVFGFGVVSVAEADFNDAVVMRYSVEATEFDGTTISVMVEDLYLLTDELDDVDLNIYDLMLPESAKVDFYQASTSPTWIPGNAGGPFDIEASRIADSFVTIGGFGSGTSRFEQVPGAGDGTQVDPFFGGSDVGYPQSRAGWYNSFPPNLNGLAVQTPAGLGVLIGRFSSAGPFSLVGATFSATWNKGLGTAGTQAGFTVREFIDCNGNLVEDLVEIASGPVPPSDLAVQWTTAEGGNGHWYEVVGDAMTTWSEAATLASERGGYLATFATDGEVEFLVSTVKPSPMSAYVGGVQRTPAVEPLGSWSWATEEPWSAIEWRKGEPNDDATVGGSETFLEIYLNKVALGTFNDTSGTIERGYVVEWDAAADCNGNGALDTCDLASGLETDLNGNRVPDSCEALSVPGDFATIQAAIDAAPGGGLVLVEAGTYEENLTFPVDGRELVLASVDGPDVTIVNGSGEARAVFEIYGGQTSRSRVVGITFTGGQVGSLSPIAIPGQSPSLLAGGGVYAERCGVLFFDCRFVGNASTFGGNFYGREFGGEIRDSRFIDGFARTDGAGLQVFQSDVVIATCEFSGGFAVNHGGGLKVVDGTVDMIDCEIRGNSGNDGGGVYYFESPGVDTQFNFLRCVVTDNVAKFDGGGFFSRPTEVGPTLAETIVCENLSDNFFGPYIDLGNNTLCVCSGDLNRDGEVDGADLGLWLLEVGTDCPGNGFCPADFNGDGQIDGGDLGQLLVAWGPC